MEDVVEPEEVLVLMDSILSDQSIPKNVRRELEGIKESFNDSDRELGVHVDNALQILEELSLDPNLASHTRAQLWNLTSMLEELAE